MASRAEDPHPHRATTRRAGGELRVVLLYRQVGRDILERQAKQGRGAKVIGRLAHDLRTAFRAATITDAVLGCALR